MPFNLIVSIDASTTATNADLAVAIRKLGDYFRRFDVKLGFRMISERDASNLMPEEAYMLRGCIEKVRRQSGAARAVARDLIKDLGVQESPILKSSAGAPIWPAGIVGSLAHEAEVAIAAVALSTTDVSLGIDIEPNFDLPAGTSELVATPIERALYSADFLESRALFVVKEAVFKCAFPVDHRWLDFQDVEVDVGASRAHTRGGLVVEFAMVQGRYIIALAVVHKNANTSLANEI